MRLVIGQLLAIVDRYPPLVDAAFVIIAWVGVKLLVEYLHTAGFIGFEIPKWLSLGLIVVIFVAAVIYARRVEHREHPTAVDDEVAALLGEEGPDRQSPRHSSR
jgi:predicted tellurium resistance membrane protein TerC